MNHESAAETYACSRYDPFCPAARGAKYNDWYSNQTQTYQSKGIVSVSANATSGDTFMLFSPDVAYSDYCLVSNATTTVTIPGTFSSSDSGASTWMATMDGVRLVSAGLHWVPTYPDSISDGIFHVAVINRADSLLGTATTTPATMPTLGTQYYAANSSKEFTWVTKMMALESKDLIAPGGVASTTARSEYWDAVAIYLDGPATNVVTGYFEVIRNYEGRPLMTSTASRLTSPAPLATPVTTAAGDVMSRIAPSFVEGAKETFKRVAEEAARRGAKWAGGAVAGYMMGGPPGAMAGGALALGA
jgi:hypothetical protein